MIYKEKLDKQTIKNTNIISILFGFISAILSYIISSYFKIVTGIESVSIAYLIAFLLIFISLLNLHKIVKIFGKKETFFLSIIANIICLTIIILLSKNFWGVVALIIYMIFSNITMVSIDIILESSSIDKKSGRIRGFNMTMLNSGFIFGPLISTYLIQHYSLKTPFIIALFTYIIMAILAMIKFKQINHNNIEERLTVKEIFKKFIKHKNLARIYSVSFVLDFFYAIMVIYTPIYLRDLGISWETIGLIFTIMLTPFIFLTYPIGYLADKKYGEKEMIIIAMIIMLFATCSIFFIKNHEFIIWTFILLTTRIGAAMLQILKDVYFYKRINGEDVGIIDFFRTSSSTAYIAASLIAFILLKLLPLQYIFLILATIIFIGIYPASRLIDNKSEAEEIMEKKFNKLI